MGSKELSLLGWSGKFGKVWLLASNPREGIKLGKHIDTCMG